MRKKDKETELAAGNHSQRKTSVRYCRCVANANYLLHIVYSRVCMNMQTLYTVHILECLVEVHVLAGIKKRSDLLLRLNWPRSVLLQSGDVVVLRMGSRQYRFCCTKIAYPDSFLMLPDTDEQESQGHPRVHR